MRAPTPEDARVPNFRTTRRNVIAMGGILVSMAVAATVGATTKAHAMGGWSKNWKRSGGRGGDGCFLSGTNILIVAGETKIESTR